ncbi:MAG: phospho-N-acetylmuramoyl-pentapeptide-transferase [Clostridia bacterium]|jgi:phospho-N-acetylmuramoyl-pentapeptide-transferase|nr:phospho-N-acetylmuramoyl-pentapeptide-transferase [Clostridia bacterium]NLS84260.1 phospho-N-acetylmuramoyl-pentapeptide-transferase [Oscillospiraceae bacterium]
MARFALIASAFSALLITALSGYIIIPWLHKLHFGQTIKEIGPTWHQKKNGTPTMGGLMFYLGIVLAVAIGYTLLAVGAPQMFAQSWSTQMVNMFIAVMSALLFGFIGFIDDFIKVVKKRNLGLMARYKIIGQILVTTGLLLSLYINGTLTTIVNLPFFGAVDFGYFYYPISYLLIIGMVNAVNLTDGIDGLASSVTFIVMLGFMFVSSLLGYTTIALFAAAVAGGCAGFLVWNFYPARVFMGDTGSMFLGGAVVACAYCINRPELLIFMGIIYLCEAFSVMLQVTYFKLTHGKRIFKMSPIHHHFEMSGWSEVKIDGVFSFIAFMFVVVGCLFVYFG